MSKKGSTTDKKKADKPAEKAVATTPRRRSGKAYGKPKASSNTGKTILGVKRNRFIEEILTQETGKRVSELRNMHAFDLKDLIESTVRIMRSRKRDRRGHGQAGRYQNYVNGPGRPRSARDAELRQAAQPKKTVKQTLSPFVEAKDRDDAADNAAAIASVRAMHRDLVRDTSAAVIHDEMSALDEMSAGLPVPFGFDDF